MRARARERERERIFIIPGLDLTVGILGLINQTLKRKRKIYPIELVLNNCIRDLFPPFSPFFLSINIY